VAAASIPVLDSAASAVAAVPVAAIDGTDESESQRTLRDAGVQARQLAASMQELSAQVLARASWSETERELARAASEFAARIAASSAAVAAAHEQVCLFVLLTSGLRIV
jgi:hypothetical protein